MVALQILEFLDRVFFRVFTGAQSVEIYQEMRQLWSKIKWHVFFISHGVEEIKNE